MAYLGMLQPGYYGALSLEHLELTSKPDLSYSLK